MQSILEPKASTILEFLSGLRGTLSVTFEEGTWAAWLYDLLKPHVAKLVVCNPRKNALLKHGNKSDKIDARKLAERLRLNDLKPVYHGETDVTHAAGTGPKLSDRGCSVRRTDGAPDAKQTDTSGRPHLQTISCSTTGDFWHKELGGRHDPADHGEYDQEHPAGNLRSCRLFQPRSSWPYCWSTRRKLACTTERTLIENLDKELATLCALTTANSTLSGCSFQVLDFSAARPTHDPQNIH